VKADAARNLLARINSNILCEKIEGWPLKELPMISLRFRKRLTAKTSKKASKST
jgi:hypothetical protein